MVVIQCIGRRRLEISRLEDGNFEIKIVLTGPEKRLATMIAPPDEFNKLEELFGPKREGPK